MDQTNILKLVKTKEEQIKLINLIENLLANLYKTKAKSNVEDNKSNFTVNLTNEILKEIQNLKIYEDKPETEKFLNSLLLSVKNLNVLKISIAIEPNQKMIDNFKNWADKNALNNIIFEFDVDPKILGGAIIVNKKGEYADFSLLRRINDVFLNQKQEILKLL